MCNNTETRIALPGFGMIKKSKTPNNDQTNTKRDNDPWASHAKVKKCNNCTREYPSLQDCSYCEM